MAWRLQEAAHLLRRAGFGGSFAEVNAFFEAGFSNAIEYLLSYNETPDPVWDISNPLGFEDARTSKLSARRNLLYQLTTSTRPLQARMLWFWHGHFTTSAQATTIELMERQIDTWRRNATGNFLNFLFAMYTDGAMLQYLDGASNSKVAPNENFARENFELFTLGVNNFTELDVREAARAFTGYAVNSDGTVSFNPALHDSGQKTILGETGNFNGHDVMRIVSGRSETIQRMCTKLYRHFVNSTIDLAEVNSLMNTWLATKGNLKEVMRTLLYLPGFWSAQSRGVLIKSPLEFSIGLAKALGIALSRSLFQRLMVDLPAMGLYPWDPGNPSGYSTGASLAGSSRLIARYRFAYHCIYEREQNVILEAIREALPSNVSDTGFVSAIAQRMGLFNLSTVTQQAVLKYVGSESVGKSDHTRLWDKTFGTLYLLACSPEYQLA